VFYIKIFVLRIAYAVLYNVSIQFNGCLPIENNKLIQRLYTDIKVLPTKGINETILFSLNLLLSLTRKMNKSMFIICKNEVSNTI